ncbi:MAG: hypothetical protein ACI35O_09050 [Bacillaceae bacterium]
MIKYQRAFLVPSENLVVTDKSVVEGIRDTEFIEIELALQMSDIKEWAEEIEMLGLDDDEDEE